jgi:uncharacterized protein
VSARYHPCVRIDLHSVRPLAVGSGILGAGGGGDPRTSTRMAEITVASYGAVEVLDLVELDDDALILPVGMVGAPTVQAEKLINGNEGLVLRQRIEALFNRPVRAMMCFETGGVNAILPIVWAARANLPMVDADIMGRAFPELQMTTAHLAGLSAAPVVLTDERGNVVTVDDISNEWAERIARGVATTFGGAASAAIYPMTTADARRAAIPGTLSRALTLGRQVLAAKSDPVGVVTQELSGFVLVTGKVIDVERRTGGGFVHGSAVMAGLGSDEERLLRLEFQNENLLAVEDGSVVASTPDIISVLDSHTGLAVSTEQLRYGQRVDVVAIACDSRWRTPEALAVVGPGAFGYEVAYRPVEEAHATAR